MKTIQEIEAAFKKGYGRDMTVLQKNIATSNEQPEPDDYPSLYTDPIIADNLKKIREAVQNAALKSGKLITELCMLEPDGIGISSQSRANLREEIANITQHKEFLRDILEKL